MIVSGFEWDAANLAHCRKHGIDRSEIEDVLRGAPAIHADPAHSLGEQRLKAIGRTMAGRYDFIVFTLRASGGALRIRPISARYMHRKEIEHYEQE